VRASCTPCPVGHTCRTANKCRFRIGACSSPGLLGKGPRWRGRFDPRHPSSRKQPLRAWTRRPRAGSPRLRTRRRPPVRRASRRVCLQRQRRRTRLAVSPSLRSRCRPPWARTVRTPASRHEPSQSTPSETRSPKKPCTGGSLSTWTPFSV
jgi:hypothetical protein